MTLDLSPKRIKKVQDVDVPGVGLLRDLRNVSEAVSRNCHEICINILRHNMATFMIQQPGTPTGPCTEAFPEVFQPWNTDHSLFTLALGVFRGPNQNPAGAIYLYNIQEENRNPGLIQISATMFPGVKASRNVAAEDVERFEMSVLPGRLMRWLLENDLTTESGRQVDLIQWDWPDLGVDLWTGPGPIKRANRNLRDEITGGIHTTEDHAGHPGRLKKIRRWS